ncbi:putative Transposase-associated domain-containing protein [Helianthus annuus]|nr:putative Transposase-associated domain-containing protein [Helianthus annuus]
MPIDNSWIDSPRHSPHYKQGLESFIEMCERVIKNHDEVRCPCTKCKNSGLKTMAEMKYHLRINSFWKEYTKWTYHRDTTPIAEVNDVVPQDGMLNVIEDIRGERMEEDTYLNQENSNGDSSGVVDDFEDLVKEAETELYPGCTKFSSIDFLARLLNIKDTYHLQNEAVDRLLSLLQESMPEGNKIPPSYYVAKKTFKKIGLAYEMIDVCTNDCALFWKENESLQNCPVCNESRWVDKDTKGTKVARKVLRYFPLTPRLRRLYCSRHIYNTHYSILAR